MVATTLSAPARPTLGGAWTKTRTPESVGSGWISAVVSASASAAGSAAASEGSTAMSASAKSVSASSAAGALARVTCSPARLASPDAAAGLGRG